MPGHCITVCCKFTVNFYIHSCTKVAKKQRSGNIILENNEKYVGTLPQVFCCIYIGLFPKGKAMTPVIMCIPLCAQRPRCTYLAVRDMPVLKSIMLHIVHTTSIPHPHYQKVTVSPAGLVIILKIEIHLNLNVAWWITIEWAAPDVLFIGVRLWVHDQPCTVLMKTRHDCLLGVISLLLTLSKCSLFSPLSFPTSKSDQSLWDRQEHIVNSNEWELLLLI